MSLVSLKYVMLLLTLLFSIKPLMAQETPSEDLAIPRFPFAKGGMILKTNLTGVFTGNYPLIFEYFVANNVSIEAGVGITGKNHLFIGGNQKILKDDIIVSGRRTYPPGFSYQLGIKFYIPKQELCLLLHYNNLHHNMDYPLEGNVPGFTGVQREYLKVQSFSAMAGLVRNITPRINFEFLFGPSLVLREAGLFEEQSVYNSQGELVRSSGTYPSNLNFISFNIQTRFGYVIQ